VPHLTRTPAGAFNTPKFSPVKTAVNRLALGSRSRLGKPQSVRPAHFLRACNHPLSFAISIAFAKLVLLGVHLRHVGPGMSEHHLSSFDAVLFADFSAPAVPEAVWMPVLDFDACLFRPDEPVLNCSAIR
jgi:hypothetical protein